MTPKNKTLNAIKGMDAFERQILEEKLINVEFKNS